MKYLYRATLDELRADESLWELEPYIKTYLGELDVTGFGPSPGWVVTGKDLSQRSFLIGDRTHEVYLRQAREWVEDEIYYSNGDAR